MPYKDSILKLRKEGLTYDEISNKLGCAKSTVSFHCKKFNLGVEKKEFDEDFIKKVNSFYQNNTSQITMKKFSVSKNFIKKFCNKTKIKKTKEERRKSSSNAVIKRRRKVKEMSIDYKGGKCLTCGYNKHQSALEFHHIDPKEKDFSIGSNGYCYSWDKIKKELDKCILVCSNCHREIHSGLHPQYIIDL